MILVRRTTSFVGRDGSVVEIEFDERMEAFVRDRLSLLPNEEVTDAHVRSVFLRAVEGAVRDGGG